MAKRKFVIRLSGPEGSSKKSFGKLWSALKYVRGRLPSADYIDGPDGFHSDYVSYTFEGFQFTDIAVVKFDRTDVSRSIVFKSYEELNGEGLKAYAANVVARIKSGKLSMEDAIALMERTYSGQIGVDALEEAWDASLDTVTLSPAGTLDEVRNLIQGHESVFVGSPS